MSYHPTVTDLDDRIMAQVGRAAAQAILFEMQASRRDDASDTELAEVLRDSAEGCWGECRRIATQAIEIQSMYAEAVNETQDNSG